MVGRNSFDFSAAAQNWLDFSVGLGIDLVFAWVFEIEMIFVYGAK